MSSVKKIKRALISVFYKDRLNEIIELLHKQGVELISTGGTQQFIEKLNISVTAVEDITGFPPVFDGRVKTLHPKIFGGILARRDNANDHIEQKLYEIENIDLVIVDLYPFQETVEKTDNQDEIIEKIDIGGISLIRAAAKNYNDVLIVASKNQYPELIEILSAQNGETTVEQRRKFAGLAFSISSGYDTQIFNYFNRENYLDIFQYSVAGLQSLRYGENPHQKGKYYGNLNEILDQIHGKEISYNNLLDIDAAIRLLADFEETTFAILKHNNACGLASRPKLIDAWKCALDGDPISAFGGVLITNKEIDAETAVEMDKLFFEIIIAPSYENKALEILKVKKNRIILVQKSTKIPNMQFRNILNGVLVQDNDTITEKATDLKVVTEYKPSEKEVEDLLFANKIVKHSKSNAIVLAKDKQLISSGVGETSRVDALKHAIQKAKAFEFDLNGAVMSSDAFFPFADCVEIAYNSGITAVVQPGGSLKDKDSIEFCNAHKMSMVFTGNRHFKH